MMTAVAILIALVWLEHRYGALVRAELAARTELHKRVTEATPRAQYHCPDRDTDALLEHQGIDPMVIGCKKHKVPAGESCPREHHALEQLEHAVAQLAAPTHDSGEALAAPDWWDDPAEQAKWTPDEAKKLFEREKEDHGNESHQTQ